MTFFKCLSILFVKEFGDEIGSINLDDEDIFVIVDDVGLPLRLCGKVANNVGEVGAGWCRCNCDPDRLVIDSSNLILKSLFKVPSLLLLLFLNLFVGLIIVLEGVEESNSESSSDIMALELPTIFPLVCFGYIWVNPWVAVWPDNDARLFVLLLRVCDRRLSSIEMIEFLGLRSKLTIDILRSELGVAVTLSFWLIAPLVNGGNMGVVDRWLDDEVDTKGGTSDDDDVCVCVCGGGGGGGTGTGTAGGGRGVVWQFDLESKLILIGEVIVLDILPPMDDLLIEDVEDMDVVVVVVILSEIECVIDKGGREGRWWGWGWGLDGKFGGTGVEGWLKPLLVPLPPLLTQGVMEWFDEREFTDDDRCRVNVNDIVMNPLYLLFNN